jgi:hypothetical protein
MTIARTPVELVMLCVLLCRRRTRNRPAMTEDDPPTECSPQWDKTRGHCYESEGWSSGPSGDISWSNLITFANFTSRVQPLNYVSDIFLWPMVNGHLRFVIKSDPFWSSMPGNGLLVSVCFSWTQNLTLKVTLPAISRGRWARRRSFRPEEHQNEYNGYIWNRCRKIFRTMEPGNVSA